jgi:hypothetical protein
MSACLIEVVVVVDTASVHNVMKGREEQSSSSSEANIHSAGQEIAPQEALCLGTKSVPHCQTSFTLDSF